MRGLLYSCDTGLVAEWGSLARKRQLQIQMSQGATLITKQMTLKDAQIEQIMIWRQFATEQPLKY